jgi:hypothetical protein
MSEHFFFYAALAFIIMHEMDAVRCREWRIFPGLSLLPDALGFKVFMAAHIPLFMWLFRALAQETGRAQLIFGLDVFFMVHFGLHVLFLWHPKNEFKDWVSWGIIVGAGVCGGVDLVV